jgi:hypothetical protein
VVGVSVVRVVVILIKSMTGLSPGMGSEGAERKNEKALRTPKQSRQR